MTPEQTAELDAALDGYRATIAATQAAYHATHGVYAQGLSTHSTPPTLGTPTAPDRLASAPTDQAEAWADLLPASGIPDLWRFAVRVDVYSAGATAGYVIVASVRDANGETWERAIDEGPQGRTHDWRMVVQDDPV